MPYWDSSALNTHRLGDFAKRDEVVIATKVHGEMGPKPNQRGLSRKAIMEAIDASLKRLGLERNALTALP